MHWRSQGFSEQSSESSQPDVVVVFVLSPFLQLEFVLWVFDYWFVVDRRKKEKKCERIEIHVKESLLKDRHRLTPSYVDKSGDDVILPSKPPIFVC